MLIIAKVSNVRYLGGLTWNFGTDQSGREWKSFDSFDEGFEGFADTECDICADTIDSGWFCRETQQAVCEGHIEVDWEGYGEYEGETPNP